MILIPAKAGIQEYDACCGKLWLPAFAGTSGRIQARSASRTLANA